MWENDPIVLQLIKYMRDKGCDVQIGVLGPMNIPGIYFLLIGTTMSYFVYAEDISNALHAAYRVEWDPKRIAKRFELYLIDLHSKRKDRETFNENEGL